MSFLALDLETTGTDPSTARIVEISVTAHGGIDAGPKRTYRINPGIPIPKEATDVHGITDDMVKDCPRFSELAMMLAELLEGETIVGFNINDYDLPLLCEEMERAKFAFNYRSSNWIDVRGLDMVLRPRNLAAVYKHYTGLDHENAHGAEADAIAAAKIYEQICFQEEQWAGKTPAEMAKIARYDRELADPAHKLVWINGVLCFNTFKNKDVPVADEWGYANWMLNNNFPEATKRFLREWKNEQSKK